MARKIDNTAWKVSEVSEVSEVINPSSQQENNTMQENTQVSEVIETLENNGSMSPTLAKSVLSQVSKIRASIKTEYDAIDAIFASFVAQGLPEETIVKMRQPMFVAKKLSGDIETDVNAKLAEVKLNGSNLAELLPLAQASTVSPSDAFKAKSEVWLAETDSVKAFIQALENVKRDAKTFLDSVNAPVQIIVNNKGLSFTQFPKSGQGGRKVANVRNNGAPIVRGQALKANATFEGNISKWRLDVTTDDEEYHLLMTREGFPDYHYTASRIVEIAKKDGKKSLVGAILEHVRANGSPKTNAAWSDMFGNGQQIYEVS